MVVMDDLLKDYLKKKYRNFMNLKDRYSIGALCSDT